jgi:hypothetical protein
MRMESFLAWAAMRAREASTWVGLAMIAMIFGSDPQSATGIAQAISLIVGGGLVAAGPVPPLPTGGDRG